MDIPVYIIEMARAVPERKKFQPMLNVVVKKEILKAAEIACCTDGSSGGPKQSAALESDVPEWIS